MLCRPALLGCLYLIFASSLFSTAAAAAAEVKWEKCDAIPYLGPNTPSARCGTVRVPRSYADPAAGSIDLDLVRVPAPKPHPSGRRRSILYNPGGPGFSGRSAVVLRSRFLQK